MKFEDIDKNDLAHMATCMYHVNRERASDGEVHQAFNSLPDELLGEAISFGMSDTVWRENFTEWYRSRRTRVKLPLEREERIAVFREAMDKAFEVRVQKLEHALREPSDLTPDEVFDKCQEGRGHWTCLKRKMDPTLPEHWEFCCSSLTTLEESVTHYLYVLMGVREAEALFKKHNL